MPKRDTKEIHFELATPAWEKFHAMFPGLGEKSAFFRKVCYLAIALSEEKDSFIYRIFDEMREEADDG